MGGKTIRIAIVIPCHNGELYLAQTLGSVFQQSRLPDEIVIVDDGSSDRSLTIAREFEAAARDRLRVISVQNRNAAKTRNIGASVTNSDALMFLDADDVLAPEAIEALEEALLREPGAIAAVPWRRLELTDGKWISKPASCSRRQADQDPLSAWLTGWYYPPCAVLWSSQAFEQVGGWDETTSLNDDGDLMMRAFVDGIALVESSRGTAYYRKAPQGETSLSGQRFKYDGLVGRFTIIEKIVWLLEQQGRVNEYRRALARAFDLIAQDAFRSFAGLSQLARTRSRQYELPVSSRAIGRLQKLRGDRGRLGSVPTPASPRDQVEEISFGLDYNPSPPSDTQPVISDTISSGHDVLKVPEVSVVIPVYNRANVLRRTLASVLDQSFKDFEVLVVDDCSNDSPDEVVAEFEDSRLRYIRQARNQGVAAARNRGMREARAPLIAFLDDDDEWFPDKLARQIEVFRSAPPDVGMVYTGVETVFDGNRRELLRPTARGDLYRELLVRNILHAAPASAVIRRNIIREVGFFDETLPAIEDYDYWLRICRRYRVECISEPLVRYNDIRDPASGPDSERRRSLNIQSNLSARASFYVKHGEQMRREGLAHLFLLDSARRHMAPEWNDTAGARRLAMRALILEPRSRIGWRILLQALRFPGVLKRFIKEQSSFARVSIAKVRK